MNDRLPVEGAIGELRSALVERGSAVLVAQPGAGKTTVAPLELFEQSWLGGKKTIMLEPRRVAARSAARRLAANLSDAVGGKVGYRIRFESKISSRTRLEVVTEGVLTRLLESDPGLEEYGLVIFDEFHERSIHADLGLALTLHSRELIRPDLKILVMSATIDAASVARVFTRGGLDREAPIIEVPGRLFPIDTRYRPPRTDQRFEAQLAAVVREAIEAERGDVLVFLPGAAEIHRVARILAEGAPFDARVVPLFGALSNEEQDAALEPTAGRRVILATAIAETSLTIPGVRVVVDGGQMRVARFSPRTGMARLETVRVTRASADQRRGRAGRTEAGVCYRLWNQAEEVGFRAFGTPEILSSDLAGLALDLAAAGVHHADELRWLDPPPAAALDQARELLRELGATDREGRLTSDGKAMSRLPTHPRIAHLLVRAGEAGLGKLASDVATLLGDRDPIRRMGAGLELPDVDFSLRVEALRGGALPPGMEVDRSLIQRLRGQASELRRRAGPAITRDGDVGQLGRVLAWAYPDRIAQRRAGQAGRFLLRNGRGASLPSSQPLARADYLVAIELDDQGPDSRIRLAADIDLADVLALPGVEPTAAIDWDDAAGSIRSVERTQLGALVLGERTVPPDPTAAAEILLGVVRRGGLDRLEWSERGSRLRARIGFARRVEPDRWPDLSDAALLDTIETWLGPLLIGEIRLDRISGADLERALQGLLSREQRARLERFAPESLLTPVGSSIPIDYTDPEAPTVAVKLQELFGQSATPMIGEGRVPLTIHLLSPAGRPVQVTRDLGGFWRSSYFDVRKEMKGRYPKHDWPEKPLEAKPTRRARRRPD